MAVARATAAVARQKVPDQCYSYCDECVIEAQPEYSLFCMLLIQVPVLRYSCALRAYKERQR